MIKKIHCVRSGPSKFSDFELACIESWKKVYPDFEIIVWDDEKTLELIQDCPYAVGAYNDGWTVFGSDYARIKLLYLYGGLYMDTDVFCVKRIPDEYFNKAFVPFDVRFDSFWTNSGGCLYSEPNTDLFKEFLDLYKSITWTGELYRNDFIDSVLRRKGLDISKKFNLNLTNVELEDIRILNRVQFGFHEYQVMDVISIDEPYLIHCTSASWALPWMENLGIYYLVINEDSDVNYLYDKVLEFAETPQPEGLNHLLVLVNNCTIAPYRELATLLNWNVPKTTNANKNWVMLTVGKNLTEEQLNDVLMDVFVKKFKNVRYTRNLERISPIAYIENKSR